MRIAYSGLIAVLVASALPSVGFAQIVIPYTKAELSYTDRLDHAVPVATVTRTGDAIALGDPKLGVGFVLGAAKLDIRDPGQPMIVFSMSNGSETPIPLRSVSVHVATVNALVDDSAALFVPCGYYGRLTDILRVHNAVSGDTTLRPGATVTLTMPVGPHCGPDKDGRPRPNVGFLVHLSSDGTSWSDGPPAQEGPSPAQLPEDALLRSAFEKLRSQSQQ
jgi:hypothetical protein